MRLELAVHRHTRVTPLDAIKTRKINGLRARFRADRRQDPTPINSRNGHRKIAELLRSTAGWVVNDKRVERIWRREGLTVP
jgi:hypothetical protein